MAARRKRKFRVTTDSHHNLPAAQNLLNREFFFAGPDRVWASDITYIWTREGWLYLAVVGDCWDKAVAESFFSRPKSERVCYRVYQSRAEARRDIFEYIEVFYNRIRLYSTLGYSSPAQFESVAQVSVA